MSVVYEKQPAENIHKLLCRLKSISLKKKKITDPAPYPRVQQLRQFRALQQPRKNAHSRQALPASGIRYHVNQFDQQPGLKENKKQKL